MSRSEAPISARAAAQELSGQAARLRERVDALVEGRDPRWADAVGEDTVCTVVTAAARLLAAHQEATGVAVSGPLRREVTPTEAVELACALLRAHELNPFDLALWFSRPR